MNHFKFNLVLFILLKTEIFFSHRNKFTTLFCHSVNQKVEISRTKNKRWRKIYQTHQTIISFLTKKKVRLTSDHVVFQRTLTHFIIFPNRNSSNSGNKSKIIFVTSKSCVIFHLCVKCFLFHNKFIYFR